MSWLIDTDIISEVRKGTRCNPDVAAWWASVDQSDLFLSVLTIGEIRRGIEGVRPRDPGKAASLDAWFASVVQAFGARILGIDRLVAESWGRLTAQRSGPVTDALLAATAQVHGLVLVSRNIADVGGLGVPVLNPFAPA